MVKTGAQFRRLLVLLLFALAMGYVEGVVVVYLKLILPQQPPQLTSKDVLFSLGFLAFLSKSAIQNARLGIIEDSREAATMVVLLTVAFLASKTCTGRISPFFFSFGVWDLTYYPTLYVWLGWPSSIWDLDVYFLLPVPWVGPVATPIVLSSILSVISAWKFMQSESVMK